MTVANCFHFNYISILFDLILIHSLTCAFKFENKSKLFEIGPEMGRQIERLQKLDRIRQTLLGRINASVTNLSFRNSNDRKISTPAINPGQGHFISEVQEFITFSEEAGNTTDEKIFQFHLTKDNRGRQYEVQSASVLVKVKYQPKGKKKCKSKNKRKKYKKKRKPHKIRLILRSVGKDGRKSKRVSSIRAKINRTNWFKLSLPTKLVEETMASDYPYLKFHIRCKGCRKSAKLVLLHGSHKRKRKSSVLKRKTSVLRKAYLKIYRRMGKRKLSKTRPFLLLHTKYKTYIRRKRNVNECGGEKNFCCKKPFVFSFAEVGWSDWVISPPSFTTAICSGSCLQNDETPRNLNFNTSCVATEYKPLRIMYYDNSGSIIVSSVPKMIVTKCGCAFN